MWRLLSWTYRANLLILILGVVISFFRESLGLAFVGMAMANMGLRERTQKKIGESSDKEKI